MSDPSPGDLLERAAVLRCEGRPFVLATVVRSLKPASARSGDRALVFATEPTIGWVGGGCVRASLEREAARALADGQPRLMRLSPEAYAEDGIVSYPMTCHSGGTLDIYLEPVLPTPELVVLGESPVGQALGTLGAALGFRIHASLESITTTDVWVVVAGMDNSEDHPAVRKALASGVPYVGMVASRRRTAALLAELRDEGVADEVLAHLKAPAGLDIGAATSPEIAMSILAEIVQRRRSRLTAEVAAPDRARVAIDPICGMEVELTSARWTAERDAQTYYFCAPDCRRAFVCAGAPA